MRWDERKRNHIRKLKIYIDVIQIDLKNIPKCERTHVEEGDEEEERGGKTQIAYVVRESRKQSTRQ